MTDEQKNDVLDDLADKISSQQAHINYGFNSIQEQLDRLSSKYWDNRQSSENMFWITIWAMVAVVVIVLTICITTLNGMQINSKLEAVQAGIDPTSARCMFADARDESICTVNALSVKNSDLNNSK